MFYLSQRNREGLGQELMTLLTDAQDRNSSLLEDCSRRRKWIRNWSHCAVWGVGCATPHGRWLCVVSLAPSVFWLLTVTTTSNYYSQEKDEQMSSLDNSRLLYLAQSIFLGGIRSKGGGRNRKVRRKKRKHGDCWGPSSSVEFAALELKSSVWVRGRKARTFPGEQLNLGNRENLPLAWVAFKRDLIVSRSDSLEKLVVLTLHYESLKNIWLPY